MERRFDDADKPLTVEEVRGKLNLRYERLNMKTSRNEEVEVLEEQALFSGQFKGKCLNYGQIGHKSFQCKNHSSHNGGNNGTGTGTNFCSYCRKPGHDKKSSFKLKKKETKMAMPVILMVTLTGDTATLKNEILTDDICIYL
jgi:hypothetical protein